MTVTLSEKILLFLTNIFRQFGQKNSQNVGERKNIHKSVTVISWLNNLDLKNGTWSKNYRNSRDKLSQCFLINKVFS